MEFYDVHKNGDGVFNTVSGKLIRIAKPDVESIEIGDIAHALSHICRFGGHTKQFYSVAQHSVLVAGMIQMEQREIAAAHGCNGVELVLEGLLHDASEAYLGDVIKPLKVLLGASYSEIEKRFEDVIAARFELQHDAITKGIIKEYDARALELEHTAFLKGNQTPLIEVQEAIGMYYGHASMTSQTAKFMFMKVYESLN